MALHPVQEADEAVVVIRPPTENPHTDTRRRTRPAPHEGHGRVWVPYGTRSSKSLPQSSQ